jgi:hypothetical protein
MGKRIRTYTWRFRGSLLQRFFNGFFWTKITLRVTDVENTVYFGLGLFNDKWHTKTIGHGHESLSKCLSFLAKEDGKFEWLQWWIWAWLNLMQRAYLLTWNVACWKFMEGIIPSLVWIILWYFCFETTNINNIVNIMLKVKIESVLIFFLSDCIVRLAK